MQTNLYQPGPAAGRAEYWPGAYSQLPIMWILPGILQPAMEAANKRRHEPGSSDNLTGWQRLIMATVIQAIKDAVLNDDNGARLWLQREAPDWLDAVGFPINHHTWQTWILEGCPGTMDGRGFIGLEEAPWYRVSNQI